MNKKFPTVIFLMGPTGSGKTTLAMNLTKYIPIELISVDSGLVYRNMNIGTAKPNNQELLDVPHRLINIRDPKESYSVANFYHDALKEIKNITSSGKIPLLVGGTMLYYNVLLNGLANLPKGNHELRKYFLKKVKNEGINVLYNKLNKIDPVSARRIHPNDFQRIFRALEVYYISGHPFSVLLKNTHSNFPYNVFQFAIIPSNKKWLDNNIISRFYKMLSLGFEGEVRELISKSNLTLNMPAMRCVGYSQMWLYLHKKIDYESMIHNTISSTRKLAKHQMTWLRKWKELHFLNSDQYKDYIKIILNILNLNKERIKDVKYF